MRLIQDVASRIRPGRVTIREIESRLGLAYDRLARVKRGSRRMLPGSALWIQLQAFLSETTP